VRARIRPASRTARLQVSTAEPGDPSRRALPSPSVPATLYKVVTVISTSAEHPLLLQERTANR